MYVFCFVGKWSNINLFLVHIHLPQDFIGWGTHEFRR